MTKKKTFSALWLFRSDFCAPEWEIFFSGYPVNWFHDLPYISVALEHPSFIMQSLIFLWTETKRIFKIQYILSIKIKIWYGESDLESIA